MHCAEQHRGRHGCEHSARVSAGDIAKTAGHAAIKPTLDRDKAIHCLVSAARDCNFPKCCLQPFRQLRGIIVCPKVHEK
jgi:hypothetical protein